MEMIIYIRRNKKALPPTTSTIAGAERVYSMRVLGVTINQHLTMSDHVDNLIASGASSIYALRMLRSHGLQHKQLQLVARMTTIASLLYASPAWWGFSPAADRSKLERLVARHRCGGYLPADHPSFENLAMIADQRFYRSIIHNPYHVLRRFFLENAPTGHNLLPRAHNFVLPIKDNNNFVSRILHNELIT